VIENENIQNNTGLLKQEGREMIKKDLECCGNCYHSVHDGNTRCSNRDSCDLTANGENPVIESDLKCPDWKWDNKKEKDRIE
jgi:hypothetical protein